MSTYDVAVIGGGITGLTAALVALRQGLKVVLVDKAAPGNQQTFIFNQTSAAFLRALGVMDKLQYQLITHYTLSNSKSAGRAVIEAASHDLEAVGYCTQNVCLQEALLQCCQQYAGFEHVLSELLALDVHENGVSVEVKGSEPWQCQTVLACDGAFSTVRKSLKIPVQLSLNHHTILRQAFSYDTPHHCYQALVGGKTAALLPSASGGSHLLMTMPTQTIDAEAVMAEAIGHFQQWLPPLQKKGELQSFPYSLVKTEVLYQQRCFLIGGACNQFLPVTAQSYGLVVRDCVTWSYLYGRSNEVDWEILGREYQQRRAQDHHYTALLANHLYRFGKLPLPGYSVFSSMGLCLLNASVALQRALLAANDQYPAMRWMIERL